MVDVATEIQGSQLGVRSAPGRWIPAGLPGPLPWRDLDYVYEFTELDPGTKLVMRTTQGPFPMQTTYTWVDADGAATRMTLRNNGTPAGFSAVVNLLMVPMMRRAMRKDLARLKQVLEAA